MRRLGLALTALATAGCISAGVSRHGNPIAWDRVHSLRPGATTLAEALAALGAPDVLQRHPDGLMLLWRARLHDYAKLGIEPDRLLSFTPANRAASTVLSNLSLVIEDGVEHEDRVALLVDDESVVQGVGVHRGIPR